MPGGNPSIHSSAAAGTFRSRLFNPPKFHRTAVAERVIRAVQPKARIISVKASWKEAAGKLKFCDVIVGGFDTYGEREELERFARRYLIPYIDIGMDVHELPDSQFLISGQIIVSVPGKPCLRCCNFITDERLRLLR